MYNKYVNTLLVSTGLDEALRAVRGNSHYRSNSPSLHAHGNNVHVHNHGPMKAQHELMIDSRGGANQRYLQGTNAYRSQPYATSFRRAHSATATSSTAAHAPREPNGSHVTLHDLSKQRNDLQSSSIRNMTNSRCVSAISLSLKWVSLWGEGGGWGRTGALGKTIIMHGCKRQKAKIFCCLFVYF